MNTPTNSKGQTVKDLTELIRAKKKAIKSASETEKPQLDNELTQLYAARYNLQVSVMGSMFAGK